MKKAIKLRKTVSRNIVVLRNMLGMTKTQFAKKAKLDAAVVTKLEQGRQNLTLDTIERIAEVLQVPAAKLLATDPNEDDLTPPPNIIDYALQSAKTTVDLLEKMGK
jgi:transcriptional regulator with XRE-family HTH domain